MLEPWAWNKVNNQHAGDTKTTVFQTLVDTGYATTHYTDSAVNTDKFVGLDKNNVVLIISHMDKGGIALSTRDKMKDGILASQLAYYQNPPPNSLVVLAGCDSYIPVSSKNSISSQFQEADLSGGYEKPVNGVWNQDYVIKLFRNMGNGMTFEAADADAWDNYMPTEWFPDHYPKADPTNPLVLDFNLIRRLTTLGDRSFKLSEDHFVVNPGDLIQSYINKAKSGDTITILPGIFNENLVIDKSLTLKGASSTESGTVVDGTRSGSVLTIGKIDPNIDVYLKDMLIRNGLSTIGGGINNFGKLTVEDCTISGNKATNYDGGGIYSSGTLTVKDDSIISGNAGNGVTIAAGEFTMNGGTISENNAFNGGGVTNYGDFTMNGGTISGNSVYAWGGGVMNYGDFTMNGGTISGNSANNGGGGVDSHSLSANFIMNGGTILGNSASSVTVPNQHINTPWSLSTTIPPAILSILYFHLNIVGVSFISSIY